jgi:hypothetical protein
MGLHYVHTAVPTPHSNPKLHCRIRRLLVSLLLLLLLYNRSVKGLLKLLLLMQNRILKGLLLLLLLLLLL